MEACGGANYWARSFRALGYQVKVISPQYVKGFVVGSKNDANDAKAIAMAAQHEGIPTVPVKTEEQQTLQTLHRIRESYVQRRTEIGNMIRGFLLEFGEIVPKGLSRLKSRLSELLEDTNNGLPDRLRGLLNDLYEELPTLDKKIAGYEKQIKAIAKENEVCRRLMHLRGVGPITAVFAYATLGNASDFSNGRHCAAYLGLVPKEHSSGGIHKLQGISKRGNRTLRGLLIHGARSVVKYIDNKHDELSRWLKRLKNTRGKHKCYVALANKLARHIWAIIVLGDEFKAPPAMVKD